jgi:hypothetical protein
MPNIRRQKTASENRTPFKDSNPVTMTSVQNPTNRS